MKNRVGEKYTTNQGLVVKIIEYLSALNCTIQFEDGTVRYNIQYDNIQKGGVKNYYHKSVYGIGYYGEGKYINSINHRKIYQTWVGMLERCYDEKFKETHPSYKEFTVDKE